LDFEEYLEFKNIKVDKERENIFEVDLVRSFGAFNYAITEVSDFSLIVEQYFINFFKAKYFYRNPQKEEVDIILKDLEKPIPLEVKIRNKIDKEDLIPIFKFLKKFNLQKGYIITKNTEDVYTSSDYSVVAIPYWKYWTIKKEIFYN
jgi:predicted AAA+ superfamily ATPase